MTRPGRRTLLIGGGLLAVAALSAGAAARMGLFAPELAAHPVFAVDGIAIRGTDPVAYFTEGGPVQGSAEIAADWNGATWHFASAENRDRFLAEPEAYAPQFGGFCAWAVAEKGELYSTQPTNWDIVDGKLYLNFNDGIQTRWREDIPGFIEQAEGRWPEILAAADAEG
ncbi:MAG: YHS domain-containing (seleno)protein [Pseudomonadota bacterium]